MKPTLVSQAGKAGTCHRQDPPWIPFGEKMSAIPSPAPIKRKPCTTASGEWIKPHNMSRYRRPKPATGPS